MPRQAKRGHAPGPALVLPHRSHQQAPLLVFAPGNRDVITREHTLSISRALPHAQLWILPDTGHDTFAQRPEAVNSAILSFLDGGTRQ